MQLEASIPVLGCQHIEDTLAFYQQAFQFVIIKQRKTDTGRAWVYLRSGDTLLMLESAQLTPTISSIRLYLYTDDVASLHHFLRAKGYQPSALRTTDYAMQEFDIQDPDGHRLTIGQSITEKPQFSD